MGSLTYLKNVFKNIKFIPRNEYLFLPKDKNLPLDSLCSIINWDANSILVIGMLTRYFSP